MTTPKRGRGRPRKNPLPVSVGATPEPTAQEAPEHLADPYLDSASRINTACRAHLAETQSVCRAVICLYEIYTESTSGAVWALTALRLMIPEARRVLMESQTQLSQLLGSRVTSVESSVALEELLDKGATQRQAAFLDKVHKLRDEAVEIGYLIQSHSKMLQLVLQIIRSVEHTSIQGIPTAEL